MTRKAILVSASPLNGGTLCADSGIEAWARFLHSNAGGAWIRHEITPLPNSNRDAVLAAVRSAKDADYTLLVFAGQGDIRKGDLPWPEAHILLIDGVSLSESELNPATPRCTMVFDWSTQTSADSLPRDEEPGQASAKFRTLFDQTLEQTERGLVKIYASQSATPPGHGASFSRQFLQGAEEWARTNRGILSLPQAISLVVTATPKTNPVLKAEYQGGRRLHHFPFAVAI